MQPDLRMTYSSARGNGILGMGWDIDISTITIDTRHGVPRYDRQNRLKHYEMGDDFTAAYMPLA